MKLLQSDFRKWFFFALRNSFIVPFLKNLTKNWNISKEISGVNQQPSEKNISEASNGYEGSHQYKIFPISSIIYSFAYIVTG